MFPSFFHQSRGESQLRDGLRGEACGGGGAGALKKREVVNPEVSWCKSWRHYSRLQKLPANLQEIESLYWISYDSYPNNLLHTYKAV